MATTNWGASCAPFLCLIFAGCGWTALPDNPEIHDANLVMSIVGPAGVQRLILACPAGQPPIVTVQKPNRR